MESLLKLDGIEAGYGDVIVLKDMNVGIQPGEKVLLIGPNGAGKSTVFKVVAGLLRPVRGEVYFNGQNITHWSTEKRVAAGLGYLLQTDNIIPGLTGEENLQLTGASMHKDEFDKRVREIVEVIPELESIMKRRAGLLSGGERQLLAISMILVKRPKLLLLDEPTAGLSPRTSVEVIGYLRRLQEVLGIDTVCMVEHNLKEALTWANRVVVMATGRVVYESKEPNELLKDLRKLEEFFF